MATGLDDALKVRGLSEDAIQVPTGNAIVLTSNEVGEPRLKAFVTDDLGLVRGLVVVAVLVRSCPAALADDLYDGTKLPVKAVSTLLIRI
jgi:hypothetical protein